MKVFINFFWFLWRRFKNREMEHLIVPDNIKKERYDICSNCPLLDRTGVLAKIKGPRCSHCGCFIEYKTSYGFEKCPLKTPKWDEYNEGAD